MTFRTTRRQALKLGAAAGVISATGLSAEAQEPCRGGTLRVGKASGSTTDTLDPGAYTGGFMTAHSFTYANLLTEVDADNEIQPELAESWEASEDARTWTFALRKGVTFHDGREMAARDVIASIDHHRGADNTSAAAPIRDIAAPDDHTVVFVLESGDADFPYTLADYHLVILPANEDGIIDGTARTNALVTGEVDAVDRVPLQVASRVAQSPNVELQEVVGNQHYTFAMDTRAEPFDANNVRQALKYAIDRQELVDKILKGYGVVGNDHPIGRRQRFHNDEMEQKSYDLEKAKEYLKKAGLDRVSVDLHVADVAFQGAVDAGQLYAEKAAAAGVDINVVREPGDGYWSNVWMVDPFSAVYWSGRPTEDAMFSPAYAAGVPWNDTFWNHERFNELLVEARAELDEEKRREMYHEMQEIVANEGGAIIPMFASYVFAHSPKVQHDRMASNWDMDGEKWAERWWFAC